MIEQGVKQSQDEVKQGQDLKAMIDSPGGKLLQAFLVDLYSKAFGGFMESTEDDAKKFKGQAWAVNQIMNFLRISFEKQEVARQKIEGAINKKRN